MRGTQGVLCLTGRRVRRETKDVDNGGVMMEYTHNPRAYQIETCARSVGMLCNGVESEERSSIWGPLGVSLLTWAGRDGGPRWEGTATGDPPASFNGCPLAWVLFGFMGKVTWEVVPLYSPHQHTWRLVPIQTSVSLTTKSQNGARVSSLAQNYILHLFA